MEAFAPVVSLPIFALVVVVVVLLLLVVVVGLPISAQRVLKEDLGL